MKRQCKEDWQQSRMEKYGEKGQACPIGHFSVQLSLSVRRDISLPCTELNCARRSLRRPWKLGLRIVAWWKPRMFCEESSEKIKFRAFLKCVAPRILSPESVDYKWTPLSGRKKIRILISKTAMLGYCKLSLYADGLVMSMRFIFGNDWNDVPCKSLFWSLAVM